MKKSFLSYLLSFVICSLYILLANISYANNVEGIYICKDTDVNTKTTYTSQTKIEKANDIYRISWSFDDGSKFNGTGLLSGNILSIVYKQVEHAKTEKKFEETQYGLMQYTVTDQKLAGNWIYYDTNKVGQEECLKSAK